MAADKKNKQTSSSTSRIQKDLPDESVGGINNKSSRLPLGERRFLALTKVLHWTGGFYLIVLASFCVAYICWGIVPSTELLILMTLPGYVITTIIGAIVGSSIDR